MEIRLADVKDLVAYEKVRDAERARIIELKRHRRLSVGENLTFLFENRDTVLFQIQEMIRTERIVLEAKIQEEIDAYRPLLPVPGELSATLFIEIPEIIRMSQDDVRKTVNRFQGLDDDGVVFLVIGQRRLPARFEDGHSKEEKMAAVHYVRFPVPAEAQRALASGESAMILVDHPNYKAAAQVPPDVRGEMLRDLAG